MTTPVEFEFEINVQTSKRGNYRTFIERLRVRLGFRFSHNIPALAVQEESPTRIRFFDLVLRTNDHSVRFRFRMDNLYLIGYQMENGRWLEFNNSGNVHLIREQGTIFLGFTGHYNDLERVSRAKLIETSVGSYELVHRINELATSEDWNTRAHGLIVVIMMISEATRLIPVLDYIVDNFDNGGGIQLWIQSMIRCWGSLSAALLRADAYPDEPSEIRRNEVRLPNGEEIINHFDVTQIMGILLGLCFRNPRRQLRATDEGEGERQSFLGLPLLQVFLVRINNIDEEDSGDLYGTITVDDGLNIEHLYSRLSSNTESIKPGQNASLIGPSQSNLAISNFTIELHLTDKKNMFSRDHDIVNKDISWDAFEIGNLHDEPVFEKLDGTNGSVTVNYAVLRNAVAATITVTLEEGGEDTSNVYGTVSAR